MEPDFPKILLLHSRMRHASPLQIQQMIGTFNAKMMKQMMLIYVRFFLGSTSRTRYLGEGQPHSLIHRSIFSASMTKSKSFKPTKSGSIFDRLPTLILSQCISYLEQSERADALRVNLFFMKAASTSIAKHDLFINTEFIKKELFKAPKRFIAANNFHTIGSLQATDKFWKYPRKHRKRYKANFAANISWLLNKNKIRSFGGNALRGAENHFKAHLNHIERIAVDEDTDLSVFPTASTMSMAKTVINRYPKLPFLYQLLGEDTWPQPELIPNMHEYTRTESKLEHLELHRNYDIDHGVIHWLWNIPNLRSCKLSGAMPDSSSFEEQCERLLSSSVVAGCIQKQVDFKTLSLSLEVGDGLGYDMANPNPRLTKQRWLDLNSNLKTLLKYVCMLYPRLEALEIGIEDMGTLKDWLEDYDLSMDEIGDMNIPLSPFHKLESIQLDVFRCVDAVHVLSELKRFEALKHVRLTITTDFAVPPRPNEGGVDLEESD